MGNYILFTTLISSCLFDMRYLEHRGVLETAHPNATDIRYMTDMCIIRLMQLGGKLCQIFTPVNLPLILNKI